MVRRHRFRLLPCSGDSGAGHARSARRSDAGFPRRRHLQPVFHDAWNGDDVPVCRANGGGDRDHAVAADVGGTRSTVPQAVGLRFLGLFRGWDDVLPLAVRGAGP